VDLGRYFALNFTLSMQIDEFLCVMGNEIRSIETRSLYTLDTSEMEWMYLTSPLIGWKVMVITYSRVPSKARSSRSAETGNPRFFSPSRRLNIEGRYHYRTYESHIQLPYFDLSKTQPPCSALYIMPPTETPSISASDLKPTRGTAGECKKCTHFTRIFNEVYCVQDDPEKERCWQWKQGTRFESKRSTSKSYDMCSFCQVLTDTYGESTETICQRDRPENTMCSRWEADLQDDIADSQSQSLRNTIGGSRG
jgi:hypothetical protein